MPTFLTRPFAFAVVLAFVLVSQALGQTVAVSPTSATLPVKSTRQFTASVTGTGSPPTWEVNGIPGGNSDVGTISPGGLYTAPALPPSGWTVTVRARVGSASASATVTVRNQIPWPTTVNPSPVYFGPFTLQVTGSRFVAGAKVLWNGVALPTTVASSTLLYATGTAATSGTYALTVANPGPSAVSTPISVKVVSGILVTVSPAAASLAVTGSLQLSAVVNGSSNPSVEWAVNGVVGGESDVGTISSSGLYTAPLVPPASGTVTITALSAADHASVGTAILTIQDPQAIARGRFLEQATFGPSPQLHTRLAQLGNEAFLDEQFAKPESPLPDSLTANRFDAIDAFFENARSGSDQLRQRVVFALSEIIVETLSKNTNGSEIVPWLQILSRNAFGNYRTLLREITLDGSMGHFLDLVNSGVWGGAANENYPREILQLFSIGLVQLNLDGTPKVDANNVPLPTYTQTDVAQLSKALTGWTYNSASGTPPSFANFAYYPGTMLPSASGHNPSSKTFLGRTIPAGQSIEDDLDDAIDIIFEHPNVGPFVAVRLIRAMVTSNPSPQYVERVATVFNDDGHGVRGDLKAVVRAILLDPEARNDSPPANFGRLRTPMQQLIAFTRALNIHLGQASQFAYLFYDMHEGLLDAPSVFGHYSPGYRIPKTSLFGPEFQIFSPSDAVNRGNLLYSLIFNPYPINPVLQPFVSVAGDPVKLVNAVDSALLFGRMSQVSRDELIKLMPVLPDNNARVLTAIYLTAMSGDYLVQR